MDPRNRSSHRTLHALQGVGITPRVHPDGNRLVLPKGQRRLLTEDLRAGLKANKADLLRGELLRDRIRALMKHLEEGGLGYHPLRDAACRALGENGAEERLNAAWEGAPLDEFVAALEAWASPAYRAPEAGLRKPAACQDASAPLAKHEPLLFADEPSRSVGAA